MQMKPVPISPEIRLCIFRDTLSLSTISFPAFILKTGIWSWNTRYCTVNGYTITEMMQWRNVSDYKWRSVRRVWLPTLKNGKNVSIVKISINVSNMPLSVLSIVYGMRCGTAFPEYENLSAGATRSFRSGRCINTVYHRDGEAAAGR